MANEETFYDEKVTGSEENISYNQTEEPAWLKRNKYGIIVGIITCVWNIVYAILLIETNVFSFLHSYEGYWLVIIPAAVAYLVAGELIEVVKFLFATTLKCFSATPFPVDFIVGFVVFIGLIVGLVLLPPVILLVLRKKKQESI